MKKIYEINYGTKATLNTGNYENLNPMYNIKEIIETEAEVDISGEFQRLKKIVDTELENSIKEVRQKNIADKLKQFRFYEKNGKKYISVTSVLNPEPIDVPNIELYGLRGDIKHKQLTHYIQTKELNQIVSDNDKKKLEIIGGIEGYDLSWIAENNEIVFKESEQVVFNDEFMYAGRYDASGHLDTNPALFDLKTGSLDKNGIEKAFQQLSAYAMCFEDVATMVILPCSPKYKKEPIISQEIEKYFAMFKAKRLEFRERFGV